MRKRTTTAHHLGSKVYCANTAQYRDTELGGIDRCLFHLTLNDIGQESQTRKDASELITWLRVHRPSSTAPVLRNAFHERAADLRTLVHSIHA